MELSRLVTGTIRRKLLLSITVILLLGISAVLWISTGLQIRDSRLSIRASISDSARSLSQQFSREIQEVTTRSRGWVVQSGAKGADIHELVAGDNTILGIQVLDFPDGHLRLGGFQDKVADAGNLRLEAAQLSRLKSAQEIYFSLEHAGQPMHVVVTPLVEEGGEIKQAMAVYLDPQAFRAAFKSDGTKETFLYDLSGKILFRSEALPEEGLQVEERVPKALTESLGQSPLTNGQLDFKTAADKSFLASYYKTGVADATVAVLTSEDRIYDTPRSIAIRSLYLAFGILSLALVFVVIFADSLVKPIRALAEATTKIAEGDFSIRAQITTRDEIAFLSRSFNDMAEGLAERERIKAVFGKFHSKAVFQKLLEEDKIRLGGEKIPVTVFFSDIRSFTSAAEKMLPEQVVEMLNEYMSEMVDVIEKFDGVVDKYVGDAIMAIWGMPTHDPARDADKALRACLEMRTRLVDLNKKRRARGQPSLKIGMGLNSGEVIAGNIGSPSRMEYTVIGDTVNTASRMESLTKELDTDLLLNESTAALLEPHVFDLEGPLEAVAKGKSDKVIVYCCRGLLSDAAPVSDQDAA